MDKIENNKYRKQFTRKYSRVYSQGDLIKERDKLIIRLKEINNILNEIKDVETEVKLKNKGKKI